MKAVEINKVYTFPEYILLEESGEFRHEFIDGNLMAMSGASREHHKICKNLLRLLEKLLAKSNFEVFIENMKVKIQGESHYYYPDIFITKETETEENKYVQFAPELIIEVLSETTRSRDMIDKFIQYRKIDCLNYYLTIEPEKHLVMCHNRNKNNEWNVVSYTKIDETIPLPQLGISIQLEEIYKSKQGS